MNRFRRRLYACIALMAVMFGMLVPTLGRAALSPGEGRLVLEVCSAAGNRLIELDPADAALYLGGEAPDGEGDRATLAPEHCVYCGTVFAVALLPPTTPALFDLQLAAERPTPFLSALPRRSSWRILSPRAPPAFL